MAAPYLPILFAIVVALIFATVFTLLSTLFGPNRPTATKEAVYECGVPPVGTTAQRFSVKFYLVAVLFILFDLEAVFLYPWAVVFRDFVYSGVSGAGLFMACEMGVFLITLFLGWYYVLRRGALEWH